MGFINLANRKKKLTIPEESDIIFVSDMFINDYVGGAELSTDALITSSPLNVYKLHTRDITIELLSQGFQKYWIFGNYADLDSKLIPTICANIKYSIIEYDYKYCKYRSPEKHKIAENIECNCDNSDNGKIISAFMYAAQSIWWMSELQESFYYKKFPFLKEKQSTVLSSVFDDKTFFLIDKLKEDKSIVRSDEWIILGSQSWIKGTDDAIAWCKENGKKYRVVSNVSYEAMLNELAHAEGLVFLPKGSDTCPRLVIEAKLLGCKLVLNDNVQHKNEIWFNTDDLYDTSSYLYMSRDRFWNGIKSDMKFNPTISGYTTTKDCIAQDYPFVESIKSMLGFCDEVVVVDGGSTDGTWEKLCELSATDARIKIHQQKRDWDSKRFAVYDGEQKALARALCQFDYCWQQDSDEIVHENDYDKIRLLIRRMPKNIPMLSLPVIEYWGSVDKVRLDVNPWKWRLSQNLPYITHGIPDELRAYDEEGNLYSKLGCDGCWLIRNDSYAMIPSATFFTSDVDKLKAAAFTDANARLAYETWLNEAVSNLPTIYHFSWFNIERKIKTYKNYWSKHWESLYNVKQIDTAENNMFFDKPWNEVTDGEINELAGRLKTEMGGWIFHQKLDLSKKTPHIKCKTQPPAVMLDWIKRNS